MLEDVTLSVGATCRDPTVDNDIFEKRRDRFLQVANKRIKQIIIGGFHLTRSDWV